MIFTRKKTKRTQKCRGRENFKNQTKLVDQKKIAQV